MPPGFRCAASGYVLRASPLYELRLFIVMPDLVPSMRVPSERQ